MRRFVISLAVNAALLVGFATSSGAEPAPAAAPRVSLQVLKEQRLLAKLPADARPKVAAHAKRLALDVDVQLRTAKGEVDVAALARQLRDTKQPSVDFANMSIEEAVMLLMMLVARDAAEDLKALLAEMDATRKKRREVREQLAQMKEEAAATRERLREQYSALERDESALAQRIQLTRDRHGKTNEAITRLMKKSDAGAP